MRDDRATLLELDGNEVDHCTAPFAVIAHIPLTELETLPFHGLGGPGFERLCYELLVAQGDEPRFFGRSGQPQYGVDLVAEKPGRTEVYQCKNLGSPPSSGDLTKYLEMFETEWLKKAGLPRPTRFVICCPQMLRDSATDAEWQVARESFEKRTGVEAGLWHLDYLISRLRKLPDVVADMFSNRHAEAFCDPDQWNSDLFKPLRERSSGDRRLKRYFQSKESGRLYVDDGRKQSITEALNRSPVILVEGLPGTGKTFMALAVAEDLRDARQRTYFVDVGTDEFTIAGLKNGIRARVARPSIFVLENCHDKVDHVAQALADLAPLLEKKRATIICLARRRPGPLESRSDDSEFYVELKSLDAIVGFENDNEILKRVTEFWRPELTGLSGQRFSKLVALCGRDLYLLDEVLTLIGSPSEIEALSPAGVFELVRKAYFGYKPAADFPVTRRLAALTQFEVYPRADVLKVPDEELVHLEGFCIRAGQPPRWHFLHSSAAELILHALWSGMGVSDAADVASEAATDIIEYFRDAQQSNLRPAVAPTALEADLLQVLNNRLKLSSRDADGRLKAAVLDSEPIRQLIPKLVTCATYPNTILRCAHVAHLTGAGSTAAYASQLLDAFRELLNRDESGQTLTTFHLAVRILSTLERVAPSVHAELDREAISRHLLGLLDASGTVVDLVKVMLHAPAPLADELIEALEEAQVERLTERAISTRRSVGTLDLRLRELRRHEDRTAIAQKLERKIGPVRLLRLIEGNGTLFELFRALQYASPSLARGLVEALDENRAERLLEKTISDSRSIGTFDWTLRDLRNRRETSDVGRQLERRIGVSRFLRLIKANGTLFELFRVIQHSSTSFARDLVEALDDTMTERLTDKTIQAGRSIGTLNFTLRALSRRSDGVDVARALEAQIGPARFWKLIVGTGSPGALVDLLLDVSYPFRERILVVASALTTEQWTSVIERGNFFELCELVSRGRDLLQQGSGDSALLAAIRGQTAPLLARCTWYQLNSGARLLATIPESPERLFVSAALKNHLANVDVQTLSFLDLRQAANGIEVLYRERADLRLSLASAVRRLVPPPRNWAIAAKEDSGVLRVLLRVLSQSEFSESDVFHFVKGVTSCLSPAFIARCRTVDLLWIAWSVLDLERKRNQQPDPGGSAHGLVTRDLVCRLKDTLLARVGEDGDRDELRARFALVGLLTVVNESVEAVVLHSLRYAIARNGDAAAWWLCADQSFVFASLILRGVEIIGPMPVLQRADFQRRLMSAASELPERDGAAAFLYDELLRQMDDASAK